MAEFVEYIPDSSSRTGYRAEIVLVDGTCITLPSVFSNGHVASPDGNWVYLMATGQTSFSAVYGIDRRNGQVGRVEPPYMKSLKALDDGVIVFWADGQLALKKKDFKVFDRRIVTPVDEGIELKSGEIKSFRIFASSYQFWFQAGSHENLENQSAAFEKGIQESKFAAQVGEVIFFRTESHLNNHPLHVALHSRKSMPRPARRASFEINLEDGRFKIDALSMPSPILLKVPSGRYTVEVAVYNPGVDPTEEILSLDDAQFVKETGCEYYFINLKT